MSEAVLFHILAKDKSGILPFWLVQNLDKITYPKSLVHLHIVTNNNNDNTASILSEWINLQSASTWASITFLDKDEPEQVQKYGVHEWNAQRFKVLGRLRQAGIIAAQKLQCDYYFVSDVDNFLLPNTLTALVDTKKKGVVAPLLRSVDNGSLYSNYHNIATSNGYFQSNSVYYDLWNCVNPGLHLCDVVHCTYLISKDVFEHVQYADETEDYEYVIFSRILRQKGVSQWLDNRRVYGVLSLCENLKACQDGISNLEDKAATVVFSNIYEKQIWGEAGNGSGYGSTLEETKIIRNLLPALVRKYNWKIIVDAGCGAMTWQYEWLSIFKDYKLEYRGLDVVSSVIEKNKIKFQQHSNIHDIQFYVADITVEKIPTADVVICRDALQHLPLKDVKLFFKTLFESGTKYALVGSYPTRCIQNTDISIGDYYLIDVCKPPFNLVPLEIFPEHNSDEKYMYLIENPINVAPQQ